MENNQDNKEMPIWRYMNFAEFFRMLEKKQLFFNALRNMDDPNEGWIKGIPMSEVAISDGKRGVMNGHEVRNCMFISSWTKGYNDDLILWYKFTDFSGIAIKSELNKMKKIFSEINQNGIKIHIDEVKYSDDDTIGDDYRSVLCTKSRKYTFEKEIRAFFGHREMGNRGISGMPVDVNINDLLDEVLVHPMSGEWFLETVQTAVKMLGFNMPVKRGAGGLGAEVV